MLLQGEVGCYFEPKNIAEWEEDKVKSDVKFLFVVEFHWNLKTSRFVVLAFNNKPLA